MSRWKLLRLVFLMSTILLSQLAWATSKRAQGLRLLYPEVDPAAIEKRSRELGHPYPYGLQLLKMKQYHKVIPALIYESSYLSMTAQLVLWTVYEFGIEHGPSKFDPEILKFYHTMAEAGHPRFMFDLGKIYAYGLGTKKDLGRAKKLFKDSKLEDGQRELERLGSH
jgi:TPR repeat protein